MNWLVPENELDKEQREFLKNLFVRSDNEQILGFPGSGKTILLLYAAKKLKEKNPETKIIFVEFTHSLIKMIQAAIEELKYDDISVVTYYDFFNSYYKEPFDYILCDEVQDVPEKVINKMKRCARRVIIAGDPNQSIYEKDPIWGLHPCTQGKLETILSSHELSLKVIHRLSKFVIKAVDKFMPNMKIASGRESMKKTHPMIRLWKGANQPQEVSSIVKDAKEYLQIDESVGILLPTHSKIQKFANLVLAIEGKSEWIFKKDSNGNYNYSELNAYFEQCGIPIQYVANGFGDFTEDKKKITLITYHSSKGLDFDRVYLPFCNHVDEFSHYEESDKVLFMVALTRSRGDMVISYTSDLNRLVSSFMDQCIYKDLDDDTSSDLPKTQTVKDSSDTQDNNNDLFINWQ